MLNSILEKRFVNNDGLSSVVLEISSEEYNKFYDEYNNEIASEIISEYLEKKDDDGIPADVQIQYDKNDNMVRIFADIHYLGNHHTYYGRYWFSITWYTALSSI